VAQIKTAQIQSPPNLSRLSHWQHLHTQYKDSWFTLRGNCRE